MNSPTNVELKDFVAMSQQIGLDESLVQGPGGNTSIKTSAGMIVKASGFCLKDLTTESGHVAVDYQKIAFFYRNFTSEDPQRCEEQAGKAHVESKITAREGGTAKTISTSDFRPSMETGFHALLGKVVVHTHPALVNLIACQEGGEKIMKTLFPEAYWVPYKSPGYFLTKEIFRIMLRENIDVSRDQTFFLENHGLIISTNSTAKAIQLQAEVGEKIKSRFSDIEEYVPDVLIKSDDGYVSRNEKLGFLAPKYLFPDMVVFGDQLFNPQDSTFQIQDSQVLYKMDRKKAENANANLTLSLYLQDNIPKLGTPKFLPAPEVRYLQNMSAEKYRKKLPSKKLPLEKFGKIEERKMKIIIPMTGWGSRFVNAGYQEVKPLIPVDGKPLIEHVLSMFPGEENFVFIVNPIHAKETNILQVLKNLKPQAEVVIEEEHKKLGPVYHTLLAKHLIDDEDPVLISYCDFFMNWDYQDFKQTVARENCDGCVVSYIGFHPHLVHDQLFGSLLVDETNYMTHYKEKHSWTKNKMDCHQSAGMYYFRKGSFVKKYFNEVMEGEENFNGEFYVSQPYPLMHRDGLKVLVYEPKHFCQWGAPKDLEEYKFWSTVFREKAKNPRTFEKTFEYWKKFFNNMEWHPYKDETDNKREHKNGE